MAHTGFPFDIPLPDEFPSSHADIATFETTFSLGTFSRDTRFHEVSREDQCVSLLFYKESPTASPLDLVRMLPDHLNGQRRIPSGDVFILTSQESVDVAGLSVRWKLSKGRFCRMRRDPGWQMVIFRTDIQEPFTNPIPLSRWKVVNNITSDLDLENINKMSLS